MKNSQGVIIMMIICPDEWDAQTPLGFWDINGLHNPGQTTRPCNNQQKKKKKKKKEKKENLLNCGLYYPDWPLGKIVGKRKEGLVPGPCQGIEKLWNMKVTVIPIVISALGTVAKGLVQGLEDLKIRVRVETIQSIVLLRSAGIPRRFLETWRDCHLNSSEKSSAIAGVKSSKRSYNHLYSYFICI